jgi:murein DD-endopeptidase MepM/ murein hydrolase activator NlpD
MKRHKKIKKIIKKFPIFWYVAGGLVIFLLASVIGFFLFFYKTPDSIYIFPENPKQGDAVFIRVESKSDNVIGDFNGAKLFFYKKGNSSEWVSFLGIDADQKPGDYKISVDTSDKEQFTKEIKVSLADFSSAKAIPAPAVQKNGYTNQKAVDNIIKNDNPVIKKVVSDFTPAPYFTTPFSFPLSVMEDSGFSFGDFIGLGKYNLQHLGVDLKAPEKTEIYAVNDGKIVLTANLSNYGKTVIIDHGLGIFSMYLHLEEFKVSYGQMIKRGQIIGLSGDTGYVTGPHLHFSMRIDGSRVDPVGFIETTKKLEDNSFLANISNGFLNLIGQK